MNLPSQCLECGCEHCRLKCHYFMNYMLKQACACESKAVAWMQEKTTSCHALWTVVMLCLNNPQLQPRAVIG